MDFAFVFWFVVGYGRKNDGDGNAIWRQMQEMGITLSMDFIFKIGTTLEIKYTHIISAEQSQF